MPITDYELSCCLTLFPPPVCWDIMGYESDPLPYCRCLRNLSYPIIFYKLYASPGHFTSRPTSWSHQFMNQLYPSIFSAHVHSSYMRQKKMCAAMVSCRCLIYSLMVHSPDSFRAYTTGFHPHYLSTQHRAVFPSILLATWWCKTSITFNIYPVTTQISAP